METSSIGIEEDATGRGTLLGIGRGMEDEVEGVGVMGGVGRPPLASGWARVAGNRRGVGGVRLESADGAEGGADD